MLPLSKDELTQLYERLADQMTDLLEFIESVNGIIDGTEEIRDAWSYKRLRQLMRLMQAQLLTLVKEQEWEFWVDRRLRKAYETGYARGQRDAKTQ